MGVSAWGDIKEINQKFADSKDESNRIYSENLRISMNGFYTQNE